MHELRPGKYALIERERRFLLPGPPPPAAVTVTRRITDRYVPGTRLRLRRSENAATGECVYKLTQKIPRLPDAPHAPGQSGVPGDLDVPGDLGLDHTGHPYGADNAVATADNVIPEPHEGTDANRLCAADHQAVQGLISSLYLSRAEYEALAVLPAAVLVKTRHSVPPFGVDVFGGPLDGLVLAEAEFTTDAEARSCGPPPAAVAEVTADRRFTGGRLAHTSAAELRVLLAQFGIRHASS
ncbi:hypothetical protein [Yinghuangia soli]|uniref:CYTH domain-containing protein n=1 Tax=Yinghuangia soli TaxID=2908204 RepID=A0AA41Q397_9ACTN|nr:hypothetical protein [Yinghuangia soli]MCF2530748.1 hypothetical protein [Yinghuangia soli]